MLPRVRNPPTIPVETVPSSPCGLPSTTTSCPIVTESELASSEAGVVVNDVCTVTRSYFLTKFKILTAVPL